MHGKLVSTNASFFGEMEKKQKDEEDMREPLIRYQEDDEMLDAASEEEAAPEGDGEEDMSDDEMFDLDEDSDFEEF